MKIVRYVSTPGSPYSDEDAEVLGPWIESHRVTEPSRLVALARSRQSVAHDYFEWRDFVAADKYREVQARLMLRSVQVVVVDNSGKEIGPTRAFHNVSIISSNGVRNAYVPALVVWESPDLAAQVIEKAKREIASWAKKHRDYAELAPLAEIIEEFLHV